MSSRIECIEQPVAPFIDGELVRSDEDETVDVVNPSNGRRCLTIPAGSAGDVNNGVRSALEAFEDGRWSAAPPSYRKATLHRWAELVATESAALDALDAGEMGKPVREAFGNAKSASCLLRFYAEAADKITGDVYGSDRNSFVAQRRVPRGVVAAVVPWNFPTSNMIIKCAPALAAGNCVVLKPSELASRSAIRLAQLATQAGLPPGVLNVVPGLGETVGRALGLHCGVDMLTFTGSTAVGKRMMEYSGQSNMKVVMTECGGKSPQIVFDDGVDLDEASRAIAQRLLTNQGQICSLGSRVLVERSIEKLLLEKIAALLTHAQIGDALDPSTTFGPLASAEQYARVMRYIETAVDDGAQLYSGGHRTLTSSGGYFVEPTIFADAAPASRIAQEEIFGPVLAVIPFDDESEAVRIANDTIYGLTATVWTADLSRGMRMARRIRSSLRINAAAPLGEGAGYMASFEPARQSGVGTEGGLAGMESYMRRQLVWINHA